MAKLKFQTLNRQSQSFWLLIFFHVALVAIGLSAALYMEEHGHIVTGMSNQIVWGLPHVFAVFLIVAASGALNVASVSSVFNKLAYKPYARLSGILAIALLLGGLAVLVLDLGRPDRLFVAVFNNNFKSIFAWNIYLYSGFIAIVGAYLFVMMDRQVSKSTVAGKAMGWLAFVWRLILTTGTGSIFGFLIAREAYDSAIMAPLFIASSFLYGLAFTVLVLAMMSSQTLSDLMPDEMVEKFSGLLVIFALATVYFTVVQHLTKLYSASHRDVEDFLLRDGGVYPVMFWLGQIAIGTIAPLAILYMRGKALSPRMALTSAAVLFLIGGLAQMYVIIIGGQAFPLKIFPGEKVSSSFFDGGIATYTPSIPEALLGISGVSLAMLIVAFALRLLPFLPQGAPRQS
ncbi:MAG: polysulfide reductase NrfD [Hyphomicrobiales bacterium]|nr:polysulfide reductase NrfD [Hyphomicrobiales bacterium]